MNEKAIASGITVVAIGSRLYFSNAFYLNPDECMHLNAGAAGQWMAVHHPPMLLWWLWLATRVSDQLWWMRLLPVIAGGLTATAAGMWLRRFLSPGTAWGMAAMVALSPNLVLLSMQLRGYPLAMCSAVAALYALDRALAERSRRLMGWHFAALVAAGLSEIAAAWVALAAGLYGLAVFARHPGTRGLIPLWVTGQCVTAAAFGLLYLSISNTAAAQTPVKEILQDYLRGAMPAPGQNSLAFFAIGVVKQFAYVTSSVGLGLAATGLAALGLWRWLRKGEERWVLAAGVFLAVFGALAFVYPFGRSRHTVLVGLVALAATGAGVDMLGRWKGLLAAATAAALLFPSLDIHNIPSANWDRGRWERAMARMDAELPEGATLLADGETMAMLRSHFRPRRERSADSETGALRYKGRALLEAAAFDWSQIPSQNILAMGPESGVWILDMGFGVASIADRERELGLATIVDEPGMVYLGRLR